MADLPGEINLGFDKVSKEFADSVQAQVVGRERSLKQNKEVMIQTEK